MWSIPFTLLFCAFIIVYVLMQSGGRRPPDE